MMTMRNSTHRRSWLTNYLLGMKGHGAGSDRYLNKPFEAEKLLEIVQEYV
jgi:DNA-binding response OmpR family regulator